MAVVAVTRPDLDADEYRSQLWAVPTDGSAPRARSRPASATRRRPSRPTAAGWPTSVPSRAVSRRSTCRPRPAEPPPADRPPPGRRRAGLVPGLPPAGLHGPGARAGPVRHGRGGRAGAEPPRLITTLKYRQDDVGFLGDWRSQVFVLDLPADFTDDTAALPEPVQVTSGRHRLRGRRLEPRRRASWPSSRPGTTGPTATWSGTSTPSRRRIVPATGDRSAGDCALPAYGPDGSTLVRDGRPGPGPRRLDFVARQAVPCRAAVPAPLEPLLDPSSTTAATRPRRR